MVIRKFRLWYVVNTKNCYCKMRYVDIIQTWVECNSTNKKTQFSNQQINKFITIFTITRC